MKKYRYQKIDAFTSGASLGNPAANIIMDEEKLTPEEMLEIGRQHKGIVSEVVFCDKSEVADIKLTYFSSECEVEFCGHGTIATMYEVIKMDPDLYKKKEVLFETNKKGVLKVKNKLQTEDAIYITAPDPEYLKCPVDKETAAKELGFTPEQLSSDYELGFINAGLRTLLVPVKELAAEISVYPNEEQLKEFCLSNGIDIILVYCFETSQKDSFVHSRVFAPKFGYLEDPATGSGNSALAYFMYQNKIWNGEPIVIEQGGDNRVFNQVRVMVEDEKVLFGGRATLRIDGHYFLS